MTTKEKLFDTALTLFSQKGYTSSSIRDICFANGVKESTVYYYYKNKEELLSIMKEMFVNNAKQAKEKFEALIANPEMITRDTFFAIADVFIDDLLTQDFQNSFIRVLRLEQGCNEEIRKLYHEWIYEMPLNFAEKMLEVMMKKGLFKEDSSVYLAIIYYSPIYFCYERSFAYGKLDNTLRDKFRRLVYSHLQGFLEQYATQTLL